MIYEPLRSEVTAEERRFLDLIAPIGIDWISTRQDLAGRFGISRYCDWADVVALPPSNALSDAPLELRMYADPAVMDLPPEYLFASFMPHDTAQENHRDIEAQLGARLGKPVAADTSNCLVREWRFGLFAVDLHTFPPELQDQARASSNTLHEHCPRLAIASSISIKSDYAYAYPDGGLRPIADIVRAAGPGGDGNSALALTPAHLRGARVWRRPSRRYSRRNPQALTQALPSHQPVAWSDPSGAIGVSLPSESLVFQRTPECHLVLVRIEPGRGRGGSSLEIQQRGTPGPSSQRDQRACLFDGDNLDSLDLAAHLLSTFWGLPVAHQTTVDD